MINFLKSRIQMLNGEPSQHEQAIVNAENEFLAMSCGSFNPRFLAKIKRSNAEDESTNERGRSSVRSC